MKAKDALTGIPDEIVLNKIYLVRGFKAMLDRDLAELYGIETKHLNRQVKRNMERFPEDFMFELTKPEQESLRCQIGTLKRGGHSKYASYVFTEHGVLMLSSVLNSPGAIAVNIKIMRIFVHIRQMLADNSELRLAIQQLEKQTEKNTKSVEIIFNCLEVLREKKNEPRQKIGFKPEKKIDAS